MGAIVGGIVGALVGSTVSSGLVGRVGDGVGFCVGDKVGVLVGLPGVTVGFGVVGEFVPSSSLDARSSGARPSPGCSL